MTHYIGLGRIQLDQIGSRSTSKDSVLTEHNVVVGQTDNLQVTQREARGT